MPCITNFLEQLKARVCTNCTKLIDKLSEFKVLNDLEQKLEQIKSSKRELEKEAVSCDKQVKDLSDEKAKLEVELKTCTMILFGTYPANVDWIHKYLEGERKSERHRMVEYLYEPAQLERFQPIEKMISLLEEKKDPKHKTPSWYECRRHFKILSEFTNELNAFKQEMDLHNFANQIVKYNIKESNKKVNYLGIEKAMLELRVKEQISCLLDGTKDDLLLKYRRRANVLEQEEARMIVDLEPEKAVVNINTDNLHREKKNLCTERSMLNHFANQSTKNVDLNPDKRLSELQPKNNFRPLPIEYSYPLKIGNRILSEHNYFVLPGVRQLGFARSHRYQEEHIPSTSSNTAAAKKRKVSETNTTQPLAAKKKLLPICSVRQASSSVESCIPAPKTRPSVPKTRTPVPKTRSPVPKTRSMPFDTPSSVRSCMHLQH